MMDERREAQASLYVLGALPPDELEEFEAAMRRDLPLQLLVRELRGTAGAIVAAFPRVAPPPALKQKILDAIEGRMPSAGVVPLEAERNPGWFFWVPWALAACFAILCTLLISIGHSLRQQAVRLNEQLGEKNEVMEQLQVQIDELQNRSGQTFTNYQTRIQELQRQVVQRIEEVNRQTAALTNQLQQREAETRRQLGFYRDQAGNLAREKKTLEEALAGVTAGTKDQLSSTKISVLKPTPQGTPGVVGASIWSTQDQRGVLVVENLPPLPPTQSYQFWLIDPRLGIPVSGGVLPQNSAGSVRVSFSPIVRVDSPETFAISVEPGGGSPTPTGRIVLASAP